jgi:hypothetical protein
MPYRFFLIFILSSVSVACLAGEKRYRVEILVLTHLHHEAIPEDTEFLRDFSSALDFLKVEDEEENEEEVKFDEAEPGLPATDPEILAGEPGEFLPEEEQPERPWADVIAIEDKGDEMREAWRRMRLSAPFRPEQYLSWEQSVDAPFPTLRIHDLEVILVDDPYAELRELERIDAETEDKPTVFSDQKSIMSPGDSEESSGESEEESELPDPTLYYRIDGTVMLKRSRFLHLELDLELREPVYDELEMTASPILSDESAAGELEPPLPTSFLIHKLQQSRQVKSQQMEYFDSPVLGVLAWITSFEAEDKEEVEPLSD